MIEEIWKDIPEYQGYQISNLGQVRTYNKITHNKKYNERHWENKILKQKIQIKKNGRKDFRVDLWRDGKPHTLLVARLVAFTFNNIDIKSSLTVDHIDGDTTNNKLENLDIITQRENIKRAFENGLIKTQIKIKVTKKDSNESKIFRSMSEAGKSIGYSHSYISDNIKKGKKGNKKYKWEIYN